MTVRREAAGERGSDVPAGRAAASTLWMADVATFVLKGSLICVVLYLAWLPLQGGFIRLLAAGAEGLAELGFDRRTAVVTLTHDPKLDDPALQAALASPAFYIGALGSRRTQGARLERLREAGFSDDDLARIHAPVGLDIRARTPGEIAASILAEIVSVLRADPA